MRILILDTIHGGRVLAGYLSRSGYEVDCIDIYRHAEGITGDEARRRRYDLVACPVHLDPDYPLLSEIAAPVVSHHQIIRWLLKDKLAGRQVIEITGAQGKSTTAAALAYLLPGYGLLHTSAGLVRYPEMEQVARYSITPASLLCASEEIPERGWFIGEISVGFCGIGTLGILTSGKDYPVASGKRSALGIKQESSHLLPVLVAPDVHIIHTRCTRVSDLVSVDRDTCSYQYQERKGYFSNPLFRLPGYKIPLMLACGAALLLGCSPDRLAGFRALPGRMEVIEDGNQLILDNANSGTCLETTRDAIETGKELAPEPWTLIIGQESASVCDNFPSEDICTIIREHAPDRVILVPGDKRIDQEMIAGTCGERGIGYDTAGSSDDAIVIAQNLHHPLVIHAVKRWK